MNYEFNLLLNDYTICPDTWGMTDESALFYRMYYICGGEAYLRKGERNIRLKKGYFYIFPLMNPYTLWQNKENPLEVLWFHVEIKMDFYTDFGVVKIEKDTVMYSLLKSIHYLTGQPEYQNEIVRLFDIFLTMLNEVLPLRKTNSRRMKSVIEYIDTHIGEELTVSQLADQAGMERSYFSRKFKSIFKMSPNRYILAKKMSEASKALANGATVYQASIVGGYTDEKAFARAFKKYMETTPSNYRKSHIEHP